jgi:hypothetical protein
MRRRIVVIDHERHHCATFDRYSNTLVDQADNEHKRQSTSEPRRISDQLRFQSGGAKTINYCRRPGSDELHASGLAIGQLVFRDLGVHNGRNIEHFICSREQNDSLGAQPRPRTGSICAAFQPKPAEYVC